MEIGLYEEIERTLEALRGAGALLVTGKDHPNPMTIGWANLGWSWGKPILEVLVRPSRHSYGLLNEHGEFSVSIPTPEMKDVLRVCGTRSGRDLDKWAECGITPEEGFRIAVPHVAECPLHYECRVVGTTDLHPETLDLEMKGKYYAGGDFHRVFYGEILGVYRK